MTETILIKNAMIADGESEYISDLLIKNGVIDEISENIPESRAKEVITGNGSMAVIPGLFDMHIHLRDPGFTYKEDIITGCAAALAGGITGVACMPNTKPQADNPETVRYITEKAKDTGVEVYPVGCITKGMSGTELCDYEELKAAGAVALSDDGKPVRNAEMLRRALELSNKNGLLVISHCEDMDIIGKGIINKGRISEQLGVEGMDRSSEDSITAREIAIAACENARIHIAHVSTKGAVEFIRDAKKRGVRVTAETCPHYFTFTDEKLLSRDADYRMNPPLREEKDRIAVMEGILDGTIDCIVTDHAPHSKEEKEDFITAPNGVVGLETSLSAVLTGLYHTGRLNLTEIVRLMSISPRDILGLPKINIAVGEAANLTLVNLNQDWEVIPEKLHSKSKNTVFKGEILKGRVSAVITGGKIRYCEI